MALVAFGLASAARPAVADCVLQRAAELPVTMSSASPIVTAKINGADASLILDTGAFFSTLIPTSVAKFGLRTEPAPEGLFVRGVTGATDIKTVTVKQFTVVGVPIPNAQFLVNDHQLGSEVDGLLGENTLGVSDVEYDLANGVVRFFVPKDCGGSLLAYWAKDGNYSVVPIDRIELPSNKIRAQATLNGVTIHVVFDTGSPQSILTVRAAKEAGVSTDGPDAVPAGLSGGIGRRLVNTWIAPFKTFEMGGEQINNVRLRIGVMDLSDTDMLLGADFFLSHRIYVAKSQNKLYFTYNGGPVFNLDGPARQTPPPVQTAASADQTSNEPKDAAGFDRRGEASAAQRQYDRAIADFTRAIALEPNEAQHYYDRGVARRRNRQPDLALEDFDTALKLEPDDVAALKARGSMRMQRADMSGAGADFDQALKLKPGDVETLMLRASLRLACKDEAGARSDFDAVLLQDSAHRLSIANAYLAADDFADAIDEFDQWIAHQPRDDSRAEAFNGRCWARALWGRDFDKALADCEAALRLNPGDPQMLDSRGLVHLRLGQFDDAIADYSAALRLRPDTAWSLYGRGLAELRKDMKTAGAADIQAATALDPDLPQRAKAYGLAP